MVTFISSLLAIGVYSYYKIYSVFVGELNTTQIPLGELIRNLSLSSPLVNGIASEMGLL